MLKLLKSAKTAKKKSLKTAKKRPGSDNVRGLEKNYMKRGQTDRQKDI